MRVIGGILVPFNVYKLHSSYIRHEIITIYIKRTFIPLFPVDLGQPKTPPACQTGITSSTEIINKLDSNSRIQICNVPIKTNPKSSDKKCPDIKMALGNHSILASGAMIRRRFGLGKISAHVNAFACRSGFGATRGTRSYSSNGFV